MASQLAAVGVHTVFSVPGMRAVTGVATFPAILLRISCDLVVEGYALDIYVARP